MKNIVLVTALMLGFAPLAVYADTLPDELLRIDYEKCVGDDNSPQKIQYCGCVRNAESQWSMDEYGEAAAATQQSETPPQLLVDMARTCLAQVKHQE